MNAMISKLSAGVIFMGASFLVQSTLLIMVALLVARRFAHRAALRNAIFRATLVAVIVCAPLCYALGQAGVALVQVPLSRGEPVAVAPKSVGVVGADRIALSPPIAADYSGVDNIVLPGVTTTAVVMPEVADVPALVEEAKPALTADSVYAGFTVLWGVGCMCMLGYLAICHWLAARMRKRGRIVDQPAVVERVAEICARISVRQPALVVSDRGKSPNLVGFRNPAIIVPQSHEEELRSGQLDSVLIHELAHLARRDCAWNLLSRLACSIAFFHPLVWVLARRIEDTSDEVADDYVLAHGGDGRSYARDLTVIAERFLPRRRESVAGVGVIRFRSSLGRRVQRILDSARDFATHVSWKGVVSICTITTVATVLVACLGMSSGRKADAAAADTEVEQETGTLIAAADDGEDVGVSSRRRPAPGLRSGSGRRVDYVDGHVVWKNRAGGMPVAPAMSPKEAAIKKALDTKIDSFSFRETPLGDVIEFFKVLPEFENINFLIYPDALRDVAITLAMNDVSLRTALTAILKPRGFDFMIWSDSIYISTMSDVEVLRYEERQAAGTSVTPIPGNLDAAARKEYERTFKTMMEKNQFPFTGDVPEKLRAEARRAAGASFATAPENTDPLRTEREREIETLLSKRVEEFGFLETPLDDVIGFLRALPEFEGLNFVIDRDPFPEGTVLVTLMLSNISLENALKNILHPHDLDFAIMNESIFISTKEGIRKRMPLILRTYNVNDMFFRSNLGGMVAEKRMDPLFLASTIYHVTGKENWTEFEVDGKSIVRQLDYKVGQGTRNHTDHAVDTQATWAGLTEKTGLLVVNQRADIHQQIEAILAKLKAAQKKAPSAPVFEGYDEGLGGFGGGRMAPGRSGRRVIPRAEPVAPEGPNPRTSPETETDAKAGLGGF